MFPSPNCGSIVVWSGAWWCQNRPRTPVSKHPPRQEWTAPEPTTMFGTQVQNVADKQTAQPAGGA